jgi:hypothetical protein
MTPPAVLQLDLFAHSHDTMLRNDALDALLRRDPVASAAAQTALAIAAPRHDALAPLAILIATLVAEAAAAPFDAPGQAAHAARQLADRVSPAALAQFGPEAAAPWLAVSWRQLARRAAHLPFRAAQPDDHAAPLWLRVGDAAAAQAATQAVAGIESWWRLPAPQAWMAQARHATDGLDATWPLLAEGAWLAAPRLAATLRALNDPLLQRLLRRFEDNFDAGGPDLAERADQAGPGSANRAHPLAWFPAWLLIEQPALLPRLREARRGQDSAPERAFWQVVELLGLERQARHADLMASRQRLRDAQPALYAAYMTSR